MRTMIENVAAAILREQQNNRSAFPDNRDLARAAIEAMREPTTQMLTETHELVIGFGGDDGTYNIHCEDWQAKDVWMTMIDAALKEGK